MSCAEHAIENAIMAIKRVEKFEEWASWDPNLKYIKATPEEVWEMAQYAYFYGEDKFYSGRDAW